MDAQQMFMMLPDMQHDELMLIQTVTKDMSEQKKLQFYSMYRSRRKEKKELLILTLIGFFGVAGIQRFVLGETGMGILYFLTAGLCLVGTIVDIVNLDQMVSKYNQKQLLDTVQMVKIV